MPVYFPREDSFFLSEEIRRYIQNLKRKNLKILDLGTGSGIQAENLLNLKLKKENILASDISEEAVQLVKNKGFRVVNSTLFSNIKGKFDLIIFNSPYLPEHEYDKEKDTAGGKFGDETILNFLKQVKKHLKNKGKIFLLLSSSTPKTRIKKELEKQGLTKAKVTRKKLFSQTLEIWKIQEDL